MKILFLCPSLEPGRDGVGDYTRRLTGELSRIGHECMGIAVNDRFVDQNACEKGFLRGADFFRLSRKKSWSERMEILRKEVSEFQPDWVSLQFVAHGFHPKGLPLLLPSRLASIGGGFGWQVMFHELWIEPRGRWSNHIISKLQKFLVAELCRKLRPRVVHTSNYYYTARLEAAGVPCGKLPLFGNIPIVPHESPQNPDEWVFTFFGSLRGGWEPEPLLSRIESARVAAGKKSCRFVSIGRLGAHGEFVWERMENSGYEKFVFEKHGELSPAAISCALQSADFGIAVSPLHLLGKSGAVAAMREHGLPVIVNRLIPRIGMVGATQEFSAWIILDEKFEKNLAVSKRGACKETLHEVADRFLKDLVRIS